MIDADLLRRDPDGLASALAKRGERYVAQVHEAARLQAEYIAAVQEQEQLQAEANAIAKEIGALYAQGGKASTAIDGHKRRATELKALLPTQIEKAKGLEAKVATLLLSLPNVPHESVSAGLHADDNEVVQDWAGALPEGGKPHWDILPEALDFTHARTVTGSGFVVFRKEVARLVRGLIQFFLDKAVEAGYEEVQPPLLVNAASAQATGQLPDKDGQMYVVEEGKYYLIPTAEVPLTNLFRDSLLPHEALPVRVAGYTPCFRREAGSWGKEVRGLNRLHQFDKVEIVQACLPAESYETLEDMRGYVCGLVEALELPYRVLNLCAKDIGFAAAKTYDIEVYAGGQGRWLEVSSVSNFAGFQARRLRLRCREAGRRNMILHTLNGSALAVPRILAALLENHQQDDHIVIPEALRSYVRMDAIYIGN